MFLNSYLFHSIELKVILKILARLLEVEFDLNGKESYFIAQHLKYTIQRTISIVKYWKNVNFYV